MKHIVLVLVVIASCASCIQVNENKATDRGFLRIPGEFEAQNAIWLGFLTIESYEEDIEDTVTIKIIKALNPYIKLNLIVEQDSLFPGGKVSFANIGLDTSKIDLFYQSPTDGWYRDPGPIFGISPGNELGVADFKYTNYMNVLPDSVPEWVKEIEGIDRDVAKKLNIQAFNSTVAMEGGAFETNGKGVLIQVEDVTLKRNPHLSKEEIELDLLKNFGMHEVIWLPSGLADDPFNFERINENIFGFGTGGHTDEFVRYANDSTILLAWVPDEERDSHPICKINHRVLSKNYQILVESHNWDGRNFRVIKVPHAYPDTYEEVIDSMWIKNGFYNRQMRRFGFDLHDTIEMAYSASYLNYIISNGVVIVPQYWNNSKPLKIKERDQKVRSIFNEVFPDRKIIGIDPTFFNDKGGGMHCRYQSEPKLK